MSDLLDAFNERWLCWGREMELETTPPKTNRQFAPENTHFGAQKESSSEASIFRGELLVLGSVLVLFITYYTVGEHSFNLFHPFFSDKKGGAILEKVR